MLNATFLSGPLHIKITFSYLCSGSVAERSIAAVLKTVVPRGTGGSNPSTSAMRTKAPIGAFLLLGSPEEASRFRQVGTTKTEA